MKNIRKIDLEKATNPFFWYKFVFLVIILITAVNIAFIQSIDIPNLLGFNWTLLIGSGLGIIFFEIMFIVKKEAHQ